MGYAHEYNSFHGRVSVEYQCLFQQVIRWNLRVERIGVLTKTFVPKNSAGVGRLHPADYPTHTVPDEHDAVSGMIESFGSC